MCFGVQLFSFLKHQWPAVLGLSHYGSIPGGQGHFSNTVMTPNAVVPKLVGQENTSPCSFKGPGGVGWGRHQCNPQDCTAAGVGGVVLPALGGGSGETCGGLPNPPNTFFLKGHFGFHSKARSVFFFL